MAGQANGVAKPLRVAQVTSVDTTVRALLAAQVKALKKCGYEVRCLCTPGPARAWLAENHFHMVDVNILRRISPLADLRALWTMYRYFRRERVTVVHTHTPKPGLLGQAAAWLAGVPVIVNTVHGFYFHEHMKPGPRLFYIWMERLAARFSSVILSQNPEDIETAVRLGIAPRRRLRFLGNGIDLKRFDPDRFCEEHRLGTRRALGILPDAAVVMIIARQVRDKGFIELFEAMRGVIRKRPKVELVIVGPADPVKRDSIDRQSMSRFGIDEHTHWLGRRADIPELLACCDVYVLPSWREGSPRSAIEAAAMARPIVATDIRGCRQVVEHEVTGLLVPLRNPVRLEQAIDRLIASPELRKHFGRAGREKALREFDERRVCQTVLDTFAEQLRLRGLTPPGAAEQAPNLEPDETYDPKGS